MSEMAPKTQNQTQEQILDPAQEQEQAVEHERSRIATATEVGYYAALGAIADYRMNRAGKRMEKQDHKLALTEDLGGLALVGARIGIPTVSGESATPRGFLERRKGKRIDRVMQKKKVADIYSYRATNIFGPTESLTGMNDRERKSAKKDIRKQTRKGTLLAGEARMAKLKVDATPLKLGEEYHKRTGKKAAKHNKKLGKLLDTDKIAKKRDRAIGQIQEHQARSTKFSSQRETLRSTAASMTVPRPRPEVYDWAKEEPAERPKIYDWAKEEAEPSPFTQAPNAEDMVVSSYVNAEGKPMLQHTELATEIARLAATGDRVRMEQATKAYWDAARDYARKHADNGGKVMQEAKEFIERSRLELEKTALKQGFAEIKPVPEENSTQEKLEDMNEIGRALDKRVGQRLANELREAGDISWEQRKKLTQYVVDGVIAEHLGIDRELLGDPEFIPLVQKLDSAMSRAHNEYQRKSNERNKEQGRQDSRQGGRKPAQRRPATARNKAADSYEELLKTVPNA